jgi:hypothetical protein
LSEDIVKIINEKNPSLIAKIDNLEKENRKLKNEVDVLEQYGRRSLVTNMSLVLMLLTSENIGVIYCQIKCKQTIALPL